MTKESNKWGYKAGPSDAMKREIGQVAVNHALCEPPLFRLYQFYSEIPEAKSFILAKSLGLRANSLLRIVRDFANYRTKAVAPTTPPTILDRLNICLKAYEDLTKTRNEVAHWQWYNSPEGEERADAACDIRRGPEGDQLIKEYTLDNLVSLSVGLILISANLELIADVITGRYSPADATADFTKFDEAALKVRDALLSLPEPSAEEQP